MCVLQKMYSEFKERRLSKKYLDSKIYQGIKRRMQSEEANCIGSVKGKGRNVSEINS